MSLSAISAPSSPSSAVSAGEGYGLPIAISLILHALIIVAVVWGWESAPADVHKVTPRYVEAKLVTMTPRSSKPVVAKKKVRKIDLAAKKREQQRLKEQRLKKQRKQQQAKDAATRKAKQLAQEKARAAEERLAAERELQRLEQERLAEQQREAENEKQRQQDFADALAAEDELLLAEQDEVMAQSYVAQIAHAIGQHWSRPPSARRGMTCELQLQLIPTGEVVSVSVSKGSGNGAFDRSAEQAVKKLGRFESLADMPPALFERYFRQFTLLFDPQDLRL